MNVEEEVLTAELAREIVPLAQKCWNESTIIKKDSCAFYGERDFQIEVDVEGYVGVAARGAAFVITLRNETLQGYAIGLIYRSMHHKKILCGMCDSAYLEPDHRSYGGVMIAKLESVMRGRGIQIIGWPTHVDGPIYQVLKAMGYVGDDIVMEKRLCV